VLRRGSISVLNAYEEFRLRVPGALRHRPTSDSPGDDGLTTELDWRTEVARTGNLIDLTPEKHPHARSSLSTARLP
jgi:hypothetical protein